MEEAKVFCRWTVCEREYFSFSQDNVVRWRNGYYISIEFPHDIYFEYRTRKGKRHWSVRHLIGPVNDLLTIEIYFRLKCTIFS